MDKKEDRFLSEKSICKDYKLGDISLIVSETIVIKK